MKTDIGQGKQALLLAGGGVAGYRSSGAGDTFTSTTLTDSSASGWVTSTATNFGTAGVWTGYVVVVGSGTSTVYGVILSNTTTVLTVDKWYNPTNPTGAAASNPGSATAYTILPLQAAVIYMAITNTVSFTPAHGDTSLSAEQTTNGLGRAAATFAHTFSNSSTNNTYTLTNTYTYTGSSAVTITGMATFDSATASTGVMFHESTITSATVSASGDTLTITQTVTM